MTDSLETGLRHRLRRALRRIESQHVQMRALLGELCEAARCGDPAAVTEPLLRQREALEAHFELEDETLFPALHGLSPAARRFLEALSEEHRAFLAEIGDMIASRVACDPGSVGRLRAAIGEHERREERLLEEIIGEQQLREVR